MPLEPIDRRQEFVTALSALSKAAETLTGVPWTLILTQAAHESDFGRSGLSIKARNLFGITGDSWKKQGLPVIEMPTTEWVNGAEVKMTRPFRLYETYGESILDWARLVTFSYPKAVKQARLANANGFFDELQKGGYATDPQYATKLYGAWQVVKGMAGERTV